MYLDVRIFHQRGRGTTWVEDVHAQLGSRDPRELESTVFLPKELLVGPPVARVELDIAPFNQPSPNVQTHVGGRVLQLSICFQLPQLVCPTFIPVDLYIGPFFVKASATIRVTYIYDQPGRRVDQPATTNSCSC
mmetsp:Transcript_51470/g.102251  ORF Transcript_51470/g.102251 Transcript_51470/m.102251 type:complete len:134 (-) Transcript_51470:274-675(-)